MLTESAIILTPTGEHNRLIAIVWLIEVVAQVVLEDVYKSFPARQGDRTPALSVIEPSLAAPESAEATADQSVENPIVAVLRRINLNVEDGEFMVLVGPSGCGKSTLLRLIAGLEDLTGGNIWVGDRKVNSLPPKDRDIAMVFQSYALYPHMTVYNNLAFGLRRTQSLNLSTSRQSAPSKAAQRLGTELLVAATRGLPKPLRYPSRRDQAIDQKVRQVAELLQIEHLLDRLPKQLSGGQKQRVALGRAMARDPQVFLMDEPLSNLDAKLRAQTRAQIVKLQRQLGTTTLYVTHDQTEAMTMGDRIAVMNAGQIQQIDTPLALYNTPVNRFVAAFIGSPPMNFLTMQVSSPTVLHRRTIQLSLPETWAPILKAYEGRSLTLGIRPEHLTLATVAPNHLPVRVELVEALGHETYLSLTIAGGPDTTPFINARIEPQNQVQVGEQLWLSIQTDKIHLFDGDTGIALHR